MNQTNEIEISREFFPTWFKQRKGKWICPLCNRPHYKELGPFFYGMTANKNEDINNSLLCAGGTIFFWVRASGCCKISQSFPYKAIKNRKVNSDNIHPVLQEVFSHLLSIRKLLK